MSVKICCKSVLYCTFLSKESSWNVYKEDPSYIRLDTNNLKPTFLKDLIIFAQVFLK